MNRLVYIRIILLAEAAAFFIAAAIHFGLLVPGYEHFQARIAELIIAVVLVIGFIFTFINSAYNIKLDYYSQLFALFGTTTGIITIIIGVGPRTIPDIIYHIIILPVLIWGAGYIRRAKSIK